MIALTFIQAKSLTIIKENQAELPDCDGFDIETQGGFRCVRYPAT
jgi:hypothetical protein